MASFSSSVRCIAGGELWWLSMSLTLELYFQLCQPAAPGRSCRPPPSASHLSSPLLLKKNTGLLPQQGPLLQIVKVTDFLARNKKKKQQPHPHFSNNFLHQKALGSPNHRITIGPLSNYKHAYKLTQPVRQHHSN